MSLIASQSFQDDAPAAVPPAEPLLSVRDLRISFRTDLGFVPAVRGISFDVEQGRCLGIVGESGCGKSATSLALMGLLPPGNSTIIEGDIRFAGRSLRGLQASEMRKLRGNQLAMIFQEPMTSLNPALTIGEQIMEVIVAHEQVPESAAKARTLELLREVRIAAPERRVDDYPHSMSGGMRQRVMIAIALACNPRILIADEPTTALDVTVQAQILELLRALRGDHGMSIILISHNLGVISELADDIAVMYAGRIVGHCRTQRLFEQPEHPYTVGLLGAVPTPGKHRLASIRGRVPEASALPKGCSFELRCPFADEICREIDPALTLVEAQHSSACLRAPLERLI